MLERLACVQGKDCEPRSPLQDQPTTQIVFFKQSLLQLNANLSPCYQRQENTALEPSTSKTCPHLSIWCPDPNNANQGFATPVMKQ